jgi:hypothetical protein
MGLTEETITRPAKERSLVPAFLACTENKVLRVGYQESTGLGRISCASTADRQREADPGCPSGKDSTARGHQAVVTPYGYERGELFEGSWRREERGPTHPGIDHDHFGGRRPRRASVWVSGSVPWWRVSAKRGEPQDRQRDATSPRLRVRRKPSRWCETTRTERGWTGGAVGPRLFGATGIGSREGPGLGSGRARSMSVEGRTSHEPQERQGPGVPLRSFGFGTVLTARDPAVVRTLRRRQKRSWSADADWFASRQRRFGEVLEGPGLVTAEGRGGRRKYPTTCSPRIRGDTDAGFGRRRSAGLEDHPDSTEAALSLAHRASPLFGGARLGAAEQEPPSRSNL